MLTAFEAPYAHETLPKGSGSITGMVAKVKLTNFDISESRLCILPLNREDINISDINEITSVLVEWDCNVPDWKEIGSSTFTDYHPTGGEASQANALLSKDGNKYFQQTLTRPMDTMVVCEAVLLIVNRGLQVHIST